eukprot:CAMPEP_0176447476 /NCGR_PEP_ID=MMETSP0127-20121128/25054_1 /TAXON_ID=938130 /ORGANISM="Platyophrya macrostoma, Strain WH" /LENGTH=100 /DNA_ID=CAMNT_0017833929 /DNA_START=24 /DNA_END=329 /DNA_ORIENTATION=-
MSSSFKRLLPALNRILIKKVEPITKSKGGIILQQDSAKANLGEVVEVGPGGYDNNGKLIPLVVKKGDTVLLPDYGGTKVELVDGEFWVYRDTDVVGTLEK